MTTVPFEPRRFRSTATYYSRFRVPYPDALIERVAGRIGLRPGDRLLDLGCGPGQIGIAFARLAGADVTGLDPEPEMLDAAREGAAAAGIRAEFILGSSYDLGPAYGPLKMTAMGRSFHWMDRAATLAMLDKLTEPGGTVVLFGDRHISASPAWREAVDSVSEHLSPEEMRSERQFRRGPDFGKHEEFLLRSAFRNLERIGIVVERTIDADEIVGRAFSMSVTSPQALGGRTMQFEQTLRNELAALSPDGKFTEIVESNALIAFRD
ncbi:MULTISPECIES: class I SAM-dependent methyltransferase [Rhizobium]|uniref:Class I SAM-dependent methyltransferase n=1 Tax=Rhizobium phaseoli TaxID=396 RepID=A0A192TFN6_9HYPH|nr:MULTISPECIES: methyltransferase domain-containing protein [Rhizobium]ANL42295.1 SAM-dependent methyltransferase protein [Rhizobium phaseoli]ANL55009.1 SAM-dependent methyltransferase protein [Rhizobium phaseoli]ANL61281.1 SAM-dependent methyltransferase protein [Rhizobium phaseoli]ANL86646.1 SAM-dependent methyltransferase protein [Rhizobium phaseoli]ANL93155.1 SAM-dependent methyltransferase protein [Rhizobium phaseoli]